MSRPPEDIMNDSPVATKSQRLASLDAYRGFTMLLLVSGAFGIAGTAANRMLEIADKGSSSYAFWEFWKYQFSHPTWLGFSLWDLVQPSFMFLVGTSMAYSCAHRAARGDSYKKMLGHALYRSVFLILLGVFLRSDGLPMTRWTLEDVVSQIGLGYIFLFLLWNRRPSLQIAAVVAILVGYWALFAYWPLPPQSPDQMLQGFEAHWNPYTNPANAFDVWFLNGYFPLMYPFERHLYNTLNFIPSLATMILGLLAGEVLRSRGSDMKKLAVLAIAGVLGIAAAFTIDALGICPISKMAWTPTWVLYSAGIATLILAGFYAIIDAGDRQRPRWLHWLIFPGIVFGMNSIAAYIMHELLGDWFVATVQRHMTPLIRSLNERLDWGYEKLPTIYELPLGAAYAPMISHLAELLVIFLILLWMYRRKIFLRI